MNSKDVKNMEFVDIEEGQVVIINEEPFYHIEEHYAVEVLKKLDDVIEGVTIMYCSGSLYDLIHGDYAGYFVLCGYNRVQECGEGWVVYCRAPA